MLSLIVVSIHVNVKMDLLLFMYTLLQMENLLEDAYPAILIVKLVVELPFKNVRVVILNLVGIAIQKLANTSLVLLGSF